MIHHALRPLLVALGFPGLAAVLNLGRSEGSLPALPPRPLELWVAFQAVNGSPGPRHHPLTVGARAMCKHAGRASDLFWGKGQGGAGKKNSDAAALLRGLLEDAQWANVHSLPPFDTPFFEIRNSMGYGARWGLLTVDAATDNLANQKQQSIVVAFRGFLEPHHVAGHETGWIH